MTAANRQPRHACDGMASAALERIAAEVAEAGSMPVSILSDYLHTLAAVAETGRRLTAEELAACREHGVQAAQLGTPLTAVVDAYLTATWKAWDELPVTQTAGTMRALHAVTRAVLRAADDAAAALADGYDSARRIAIRREEALRREFIDDLLDGRGDLELLIERAERFGLRLTGHHAVAVAATAEEPISETSSFTRRVDAEVQHRFGSRDVLVATKTSLLVCVIPVADGGVIAELAALLHRLGAVRVAVGRPRPGPTGVARSHKEAIEALDLAARLGLDPVVEAASLLVYRVLLRDRGALAELVDGVLAPLQLARGGAEPLLDTLAAYFQSGGVAVQTARRLHIGVRTVTYRLGRVRALTGYSATDPADRFTLEAAVLGARLLDWPATPIEPLD